MRYRTVRNTAELQRLMALQCKVNGRPMEGAQAGKQLFIFDGGRRVEALSLERAARLPPVFRPGLSAFDVFRDQQW